MNVQKDASCPHGVTMLHRSVSRKYNRYSMCTSNPTEGCRKVSIPMDTLHHKLIRRSDMQSAGYGPSVMSGGMSATNCVPRKVLDLRNNCGKSRTGLLIKTTLLILIIQDSCCIIAHYDN